MAKRVQLPKLTTLPIFHIARLKLTLSYALIILLITAAFSTVIDRILVHEVRRFSTQQRVQLEQRLQESHVLTPDLMRQAMTLISDLEFEKQIIKRIHLVMLLINLGILVIATALSYILAGQSLQPIHTMVEEQQRFISDASHELKTPLTALRTTIEVSLRNPKLTLKESKNLLKENLEEIDNLQKLSEALLRMHSYHNLDTHLEIKSLQFDKVVAKAIKTIQPLANKSDIKIFSYLKPVTIKGDETKLVELIMILLDNAIKYSPSKSRVTVMLDENKPGARLQIIDQGRGISKSDLPYIFDRFYKADSSRSHLSYSSFGLGLSIAKQIVQLHQGSITAKSKEGQGTVFTVFLPKNSY